MSTALQVLFIEDTDSDAELALRNLEKAGFAVTSQRVETAEVMKAALDTTAWDIVISDYSLPSFSAPAALGVLQDSGKDIPFIVVSGTISEETAIDLMRMGAADYLMKDSLVRLGVLVKRELNIAQVRRERNDTLAALEKSEDWSNRIYNATSDAMFLLAVEPNEVYRCVTVNAAYLKGTGQTENDVIGKRVYEVIAPGTVSFVRGKFQEAIREGHAIQYEESIDLLHGMAIFDTTITPIFDEAGNCTHLLGSSREITDRKKAESLQRESEEKFRQFVERSNDVFFRQNYYSAQFEYVSSKAIDVLGYTPEELMEMDFNAQLLKTHPDDRPSRIQFQEDLIQADAKGEDHIEREFQLLNKQGEYQWIRGNYSLLRGEDHTPRTVIGSLSNITQRKQAEKVLREGELYLRTILHTTRDGFWMLDKSGKVIDANEASCKMLGYSLDELRQMELKDLETMEDPAAVAARRLRIITNGSEQFKSRQRRKDGSIFDAEISVTYLDEEGGRFICFSRDITERKRIETSLQNSEEKFSTAFRVSPDAININRLEDGLFIEINDGFRILTGYTDEDVMGKTSLDINVWGNPQDRSRLVHGLREKDMVNNLEAALRCKDGSIKICLMSARIIDIQGEKCILSITRDITDRKLKESEYTTFIQTSFDGFWSVDDDGHFLDVNDALCQLLRYSREELLGMAIADIEVSRNSEEVAAHVRKMKQKGGDHFQTRHRRKDGTLVDVEISIQYVALGKRFYAFIHDISERKRAEEALRESEYFFKETQRVGNIGSYKADFSKGLWESSEVLDEIFGIDREYIRSVPGWLDIVHPDDRPMMDRYLREEVISKHQQFNLEYRIARKSDGEMRWVHGLGETEFDMDANILTMIGTIRDVTARKQAEEKLNDQIEELRRWHAVTLGRESRILELKSEINKLLQQAGMPARFGSIQEYLDE